MPPADYSFGGRLWITQQSGLAGKFNTSFASSDVLAVYKLNKIEIPAALATALAGKRGLAAADAICAIEAVALGLVTEPTGLSRYKALLVDEAGCDGKPCRRASVTPGVGDGAIDWVIKASAAYFKLDNQTLVAVSNLTRMLGKQGNGSAVLGGGNQLAPMSAGWTTPSNSTCNSWRWSVGMPGGPFGVNLGGAGWPGQPLYGDQGRLFPCDAGDFVCVEMSN